MYRSTAIVFLIVTSTIAGTIHYDWNISASDVQIDTYGEWDVISIDEGIPVFPNGYPNLPAVPRCYVIPQGTSVTNVEVTNITTINLGRTVFPIPTMILPLSGDLPEFPNYAERCLDGMSSLFPSSQIAGFKTGTKTGYRLGSYSFVPFIYNQQIGELFLITSADINLIYHHDSEAPVYNLSEDQVELAKSVISTFVDNTEMLEVWSPAQRAETDDDVDVVVIGYAQQSEQLDDLVEMHFDWGYSSECVTIQWINANVAGFDIQEKIRNYLKNLYEISGLQFVVMCGDVGATTRFSSLEDPTTQESMDAFTDLYFSDLDGMWDGDGDHEYGEEEDGIDYYTDVYIGRYPASITETDDLITMVDKVSQYASQPEPGEWRSRALLLGGIISTSFASYDWCHGSKYCDSVATFFPIEFQWNSVYEDSSGGHANNQLELFNQGVSYMVYAAHGLPTEIVWYHPFFSEPILTCDSVELMENGSKLTWVDGMVSCNTGDIGRNGINRECLCEMMFQQSTGGAVVAMGNSATSYVMLEDPGPTGWISIYHACLVFDQNLELAGVTLGGAKDMMWANWNSFYLPRLAEWSLQELNLLGDPCTKFAGLLEGVESGASQQLNTQISPNPVWHTMCVNVTLTQPAPVQVVIFDMAGRAVLLKDEEILGAGEQSFSMNVSTLPAGIYMVNVVAGDQNNTVKCLVLR